MSVRARRRAGAVVLLWFVALFGGVAFAGPSQAHAYIVSTTPGDGDQLGTPPAAVTVTFSERITLASGAHSASLVNAAGARVQATQVSVLRDGRTLRIRLPAALPRGVYVARWAVISADQHPVSGALQFGNGVPVAGVEAPPTPQASAAGTLAVGTAKAVVYGGLILALGLIPAALLLRPEAAEWATVRAAAAVGAGVAALASIVQVPLQRAWDASALPPGTPGLGLVEFASESYASSVWVRIVALVACVLLIPSRPVGIGRVRLAAWAFAASVVVATVVRNGHGGTQVWRFLTTFAHAAAVIVWIGGVVVLAAFVLRGRLSSERVQRLPAWSVLALTAVTVLLVSGVVQSVVQVRHVQALVTTSYGYVLLVKLALVAILLVFGWFAHRSARRQVREAAGEPDGRPRPGQTASLRSRSRREVAISAGVVLVSGVLSSTTPAEAEYAPTERVVLDVGPYRTVVQVSPARRGPQSFRITLTADQESTLTPKTLTLQLRQGSADERVPVRFPYRIPGRIVAGEATPTTFASRATSVAEVGTWTGLLTVVAVPKEQYVAEFTYQVY